MELTKRKLLTALAVVAVTPSLAPSAEAHVQRYRRRYRRHHSGANFIVRKFRAYLREFRYLYYGVNDALARNEITIALRSMLNYEMAAGKIYAYNVRCNESNNPPSSEPSGIITIEVAFKVTEASAPHVLTARTNSLRIAERIV